MVDLIRGELNLASEHQSANKWARCDRATRFVHGGDRLQICDHRGKIFVGHRRVLVRRHQRERSSIAGEAVTNCPNIVQIRELGGETTMATRQVRAMKLTGEWIIDDFITAIVGPVTIRASAGRSEITAAFNGRRVSGDVEAGNLNGVMPMEP